MTTTVKAPRCRNPLLFVLFLSTRHSDRGTLLALVGSTLLTAYKSEARSFPDVCLLRRWRRTPLFVCERTVEPRTFVSVIPSLGLDKSEAGVYLRTFSSRLRISCFG